MTVVTPPGGVARRAVDAAHGVVTALESESAMTAVLPGGVTTQAGLTIVAAVSGFDLGAALGVADGLLKLVENFPLAGPIATLAREVFAMYQVSVVAVFHWQSPALAVLRC